MIKVYSAVIVLLGCFISLSSCNNTVVRSGGNIRFTSLPPGETNIVFRNTITENDSVNLIVNEYSYMGSGVSVGDFNNDLLPDVFFGANQVSCGLYINKGNFRFNEITREAGLKTSSWITGSSVIDINNDGFDDIYLCVSGSKDPVKRRNLLYINNGNLTFTERAAAYGLADTGYSTQAAFMDYDKDGDLDMYLVNHVLYQENANTIVHPDFSGKSPANDRLFRNDGILPIAGHPVFSDITSQAGIKEPGYGLGIVVSDFNNDNWPDIYVANDYIANDVLWINNRNGTFSNRIPTAVRHTSYSSMGVDAADINNDNLPDISTLDMLPENNERKKMMFSFMSNERYEMERRSGYHPSFMRNMLQLNNGTRNSGDTIDPFFSEIGQLSGIYQTDWSWSVLMADFDNDGWRDVHITNGMGKDMLNNDYIYYRNDFARNGQFSDITERNKKVDQKLGEYGSVELNNYCFRNNGDLTFSDVSADAGLNSPAISNGCAYADFDNDGDLDLVVNNINKEATVLRNDVEHQTKDSSNNFISITLKGNNLNPDGFGAKVSLYAGGNTQFAEQNPVRGYLSTIAKRLFFGLGKIRLIDSVVVVWPNDEQQTIKNIPAGKPLVLVQENATEDAARQLQTTGSLFTDVASEKNIEFIHKETFFFDYSFQQLLPQKYSQLGPFITHGDINGDGLVDFFVGGAYNQSGRFFIQQSNGRFRPEDLTNAEKEQEDLGCLLFDADGDKDLDLFINSGGYEYDAASANYLPRLYINNGKGSFTISADALPESIITSAQCITGADYDGDGDTDLFIGGRVSPNRFPLAPRSFILENKQGKFADVTNVVCPELHAPGMVTAMSWTDFNNDNKPDMVVAGEWMPIRFFQNGNGRFREVTSSTGLENMSGQWRSLAVSDIDRDGDMDFVAGNLGLNNRYGVSPKQPITLFAKDIDGNGSVDPILAYYMVNNNGQRNLYPAIGRDQFSSQVPSIKKRYIEHAAFSKDDINNIFTPQDRDGMLTLTCEETRTCWFENIGSGKFVKHALPTAAQFAPVNAIVCTDADGDGKTDILIAGNEYQAEVMTGRYDASYGLMLKGDESGNFSPVSPAKSGLIIDGDVKDMKLVLSATGKLLVVAVNDNKLRVFDTR